MIYYVTMLINLLVNIPYPLLLYLLYFMLWFMISCSQFTFSNVNPLRMIKSYTTLILIIERFAMSNLHRIEWIFNQKIEENMWTYRLYLKFIHSNVNSTPSTVESTSQCLNLMELDALPFIYVFIIKIQIFRQ